MDFFTCNDWTAGLIAVNGQDFNNAGGGTPYIPKYCQQTFVSDAF